MKTLPAVKPMDFEKERSEKNRSISDFLESYNENLPPGFPLASNSNLKIFQNTYPSLFKVKDSENSWSLDRHRKKVMDWLPQYIKSLSLPVSQI